ncbi:serine-rich adhesin for platelets isoform X2 [Hippoglossus hippoglossus]|nr:serine-rich adhesin for platelets isoform X2 [Hippoglossus hippoglossus]
MDVLNLWKDDPEELLFELGFGRDEPDLSGRIPARFINFQSQARGISLQVFLGAQKNRLDLENPDVSNRFRELEVLQHVTTKFCSLVVSSSSSSLRAPVERRLSPEARERRRRIGLRFRQASKKSLCQTHNNKTQEISTPSSTCAQYTASESLQPPPSLGEEKATLERVKPGLLADGQGARLNPQLQPHMVSFNGQERALSPGHLTEGPPLTANTFLERKKSREQANELFEMEEALPDPSGRNPGSQRSEMPDSPSSRSQHNSSSHPLSPSLISSGGEKFHLSSPCPFPEPSKYDPPCSEIEIPPHQVLSSPASSSRLEYLELHHRTRSQSPTLTSAALCISVSPTASSIQADSEDKDAPYPYLSTLPQDLQDIACPTMTSVPPSPSPNLDCPPSTLIAVPSTQSDFSFGSPGNTQSEWTEVLHENSLAVSGSLSSLLPFALHDFHCPSYFDSSQLTESFSQSPENESKDSVFSHSDGIGLSEEPTNTQKEQDDTSLSLSFQLEKEEDNFSHPSLSFLDSFKFEEGYPTLSHLSRETFFPVCLSALSSQSHPHTDLIDSAPVRKSDLTEQSIAQQGQSSSHDDNTDFIPSSTVQDVISVKMDQLSLDTEGSPQRRRKGEGETHTDTVQTQDTADKESSADLTEGFEFASEELCNQTVMDPQVLSHSLCDEFSAETKPEELSEEINGTESESPRSYFVLNKLPELQRRTEVEPKDLIETEDLDLVFETSVDSLDGETVDVDNFFQQLETEGRVYWAEPIQVLNPTHELSGSSSSEVESPENSSWHIGSAALDSTSSTVKALSLPFLSSATTSTDQNPEITTTASSDTPPSLAVAPFISLPANSDLRLSNRSVSVQLSSSLSSHIVQRKDVPYVDDSKHTSPLPSVFPLDTSNPFRAVQVWTDVQIQRNIQKLSRQATHTVPREATTSEMTQRSTLTFSSSQSFPLMSTDSQSFDISPGMTKDYRTVSASVDTALWSDKEEEVDRSGNKHKENLWEGNQSVSMACCSSCDDHCTCCTQNTYHNQHSPFSLGDLEELMLCLQHFRSVQSNMEEQLSEDQASVYSSLSDQDREKIQDLEVLRGAVKQEAAELETHLNQLTHHCDDSLKTKMQRLLEEQSLLCSQLFLPGAVRTSSGLTPNRTVSTQCCLLPWTSADVQSDHISSCSTWNENSPRQSPSGSESSCKGLGSFSEPM